MNNTFYIIVPCFNEEKMLPLSAPRLAAKLRELIASGKAAGDSRILFVDDGSRDGTWEIIRALHSEDEIFSALRLSRNRGHQNALMAGLEYASARADASISIDADLQDDIDAMDAMAERFAAGCDIVYGVRSDRTADSAAKRTTAEGYYKLVRLLGGEIVYNHADYRLMSRRAMLALMQFPEKNLFLRGLVPMLGFKTAEVEYARLEREAGESKYTLSKMLNLAADGISSLSARPLRIMGAFGLCLFALGLVAVILLALLGAGGVWLVLASVWGAAGLVLAGLGLLGEYVGKAYVETKNRPRYFISDILE
jgi:glycosyltransferase involved in cell wall biosynthesis